MMAGALYLVATPIGNLGDISQRAAQTLAEADFIAAEDTRVTRKLLLHLNIKKQLISYHEHNKRESGEKIFDRIMSGETCALVTDAGTPGISDPGADLVRTCIENGLSVTAIPGPCAVVAALTVSGLPVDRFTFEGFLSTIRKIRFDHLNDLKDEKRTMVFFEAPHKLVRTLNDMLEVLGDRRVSISRELTKIFEETLRFTLSEAVGHFEQIPPRGEFVLVVEGAGEIGAVDSEALLAQAVAAVNALTGNGMSIKDAIKKAAQEQSVPKNALYNAVIHEE